MKETINYINESLYIKILLISLIILYIHILLFYKFKSAFNELDYNIIK